MLIVRGEFVLRIVCPSLCTRQASIMCTLDISCRALGTDQETSRLPNLKRTEARKDNRDRVWS